MTEEIERKENLLRVIQAYAEEDTVLAFSGGVDSALLLYLLSQASKKTGKKLFAVTFQTSLHPQADVSYARQTALDLDADFHILKINELEDPRILENPPERCYYCKKMLFQKLLVFAREHQAETVLEGSNQDDLNVYRPGLRAIRELGIASPLAQCQITKAQVRRLAQEYGLPCASRPSAPCLATRLPYHTHLDIRLLERIDQGEQFLKSLGMDNIRIRVHGDIARIEADPEQFPVFFRHREEIIRRLKALELPYLTLDLEGFRSGSMDIRLKK